MKFDDIKGVLKSMMRPVYEYDIWDDEIQQAHNTGYNAALEDVAQRIKLELEREVARVKYPDNSGDEI